RPFLKGTEALVETADDTPVEPETARRKTPQEGAVMADENEGTTELREPVFQPFDGRKIEMVGRLIEKKNIRLFREHPRQRRLAALATGEFRRIGGGRKLQLVERRRSLVGFRAAGGRIINDGLCAAKVGHLFEIGDAGAGLAENLAAIRIDKPRRNAEQGGLAAAIPPDKAKPVARRKRKACPANQNLIGEYGADVAKSEERSGQFPNNPLLLAVCMAHQRAR